MLFRANWTAWCALAILSKNITFVNAGGIGWLPLSEFKAWFQGRFEQDYLADIGKRLGTFTSAKYLPPDPTYVPGPSTFPPTLQTLFDNVKASLDLLQAEELDQASKGPGKPIYNAESRYLQLIDLFDRPFSHSDKVLSQRSQVKAALKSDYKSVFDALQDFSNHISASNLDYLDLIQLALWIFDGHIDTERKAGPTAFYSMNSRDSLAIFFKAFSQALEKVYYSTNDFPNTIRMTLKNKSNVSIIEPAFRELFKWVRGLQELTEMLHFEINELKVGPENEVDIRAMRHG
ncbi:hypothetical protein ABW20_dc0109718 [Dactylellina cionopaga]|nr:hypothetical protein ABW20_dc0109718 [Dactylellina cionopaga]